MQNKKGVSLIVLVITIIVMIILAAAVVITLSSTGIIGTAHNASIKTETAELTEAILTEILLEQENVDGKKISEAKLVEICSKYGEVTGKGNNMIITTPQGNIIRVFDICPEDSVVRNSVTALEIYDKNGNDKTDANYNPEKLHVGDFVKYNAGTWTADEIAQIEVGAISSLVKANGSTEKPTLNYQFGGFAAGTSSKNKSVSGLYETEYWRVFDVDETTGVTTLISAGCPEFYRHENYGNASYISEYILTGNINSNAPTSLNLGESNYKTRNYSAYVNTKYGAISASTLSVGMLENWFAKHVTELTYGEDNAAFTALNGQYETLIKLNEGYIVAGALNEYLLYCYYSDKDRLDNFGWDSRGLRICVQLDATAKFSETHVDTLEITNASGKTFEYNVWDLYAN